MKRFFIVHRWDGSPDGDWYPWLKQGLEKHGFFVDILEMPDPATPEIEAWVEHLNESLGDPTRELFLIGHSIGCQAILRYVEQLPEKKQIGGAIFVGGWFDLTGLETDEERAIVQPWIETEIDLEKVKKQLSQSFALFSDNDPFVPLTNKTIFEQQLGSRTAVEHEQGHFTSIDGVTELPSVLKAALDMSNGSK